ncbi:hypothetical protein [Flavobacterium sp. I3-2]|uniref:hypothetical protein n=1 Tax=Flavobacterium sp. I3-2 TaxID=2748319 RepID=UPI0015B1B255|nr:hypothetical protein [Flavobacterium sp. I3-2]
MKKEHTEIIKHIVTYLEENPTQRFGQALFNLGINEFKKNESEFELRDIYNDADNEIIKRINNNLNWFKFQEKVNNQIEIHKEKLSGMTVNEKLYVTELMSDFDYYRIKNKKYSEFILVRLNVDYKSIEQILK